MHFVAIGLGSRAELFKQVRRVGYTCRTFLKVNRGTRESVQPIPEYNARVPLCTTTRYFEICHRLALHLSSFRNVWQKSEDRLPTQDRTLFSSIEHPSRYVPNYFFVQRPHIWPLIQVFSIT